jgi:hypothetical protein
MIDGFLIGYRFVARHFAIRAPGGIDIVLPDTGGVHAEHGNQLL